MATNTPLQSIQLTSNAQTVTFSNIDQNYTDLYLVMNFQLTSYGVYNLKFNADTSSSYSTTFLYGVSSGRTTSQTSMPFQQGYGPMTTTGNYQTGIIDINNYSNSTSFKTVLYKTGNAATTGLYPGVEVMSGLWRKTEAINSITLDGGSNPFGAGSTFDLYGIKAGTPKAFGGNTVQTDGTYWYHTFTSSGTFTPSQPLTTDYLVVAGGGGAGGTELNATLSAPGGAGGLRSTVTATGGGGSLESAISLLSGTSYTVTIGAGGAGGAASPSYTHGSSGSDSVFGSITSLGGGGGGFASSGSAMNGYNGGSGGGGNGGGGASFGVGGNGTAGQGYAGGTGSNAFVSAYAFGAGGGGGAGAAGTNGSSTAGGNGGIGVQITALANITGTGASGYYAGGGGGGVNSSNPGGSGGAGGGGAGGTSAGQGVAGTANTGGGAGGSGTAGNFVGRSGGSGIVIVRYPV